LPLETGGVAAFDPFVGDVRRALAELGAGRFDYLVNNAGTSLHNAFDQTTDKDLDYNVHFKGVFFLTQKLPPLPQRRRADFCPSCEALREVWSQGPITSPWAS
jgi:NAD(P)-dependent dehydrogenase (short-subunit alcohol dehydrogenase family)